MENMLKNGINFADHKKKIVGAIAILFSLAFLFTRKGLIVWTLIATVATGITTHFAMKFNKDPLCDKIVTPVASKAPAVLTEAEPASNFVANKGVLTDSVKALSPLEETEHKLNVEDKKATLIMNTPAESYNAEGLEQDVNAAVTLAPSEKELVTPVAKNKELKYKKSKVEVFVEKEKEAIATYTFDSTNAEQAFTEAKIFMKSTPSEAHPSAIITTVKNTPVITSTIKTTDSVPSTILEKEESLVSTENSVVAATFKAATPIETTQSKETDQTEETAIIADSVFTEPAEQPIINQPTSLALASPVLKEESKITDESPRVSVVTVKIPKLDTTYAYLEPTKDLKGKAYHVNVKGQGKSAYVSNFDSVLHFSNAGITFAKQGTNWLLIDTKGTLLPKDSTLCGSPIVNVKDFAFGFAATAVKDSTHQTKWFHSNKYGISLYDERFDRVSDFSYHSVGGGKLVAFGQKDIKKNIGTERKPKLVDEVEEYIIYSDGRIEHLNRGGDLFSSKESRRRK